MNTEQPIRATSRRPGFAAAALSLAVTLLVWIVCSWPLPRHVASTVPHGVTRPDDHGNAILPMEAGDHLQLMYHFWLFKDMLAGRTPWFGNIYEFNLGDDAARREPGAYYFPFSLFFAVGDVLAGRAFGWNLASFGSLWLTVVFTFWLVRRMGAGPPLAWLLAGVVLCLPYRWHALMGGSPTGFSMCWPPLLMVGLDLAVREERARGGALAGLALLFAGWDDTHTLFFGALLCPLWCLVCFVRRTDFAWAKPEAYLRIVAALVPVFVGLFLTLITTKNMTGSVEKASLPGRTPHEVLLSSPSHVGLLFWTDNSLNHQIYFGWCMAALCLAGSLAALWLFRRDRSQARTFVALVLVGLTITVCVALSLGFRGWFDGLAIRAARKLLPPYGMIRQPAKVFCLMPSLLAVSLSLSLGSLLVLAGRQRWIFRLVCAVLLLAGVEYTLQFHVHLSRVDDAQGAYAAVVRAGDEDGKPPHAIVLPIWPGDSHFTSIYQHHASLYRIRLVNGYRPFVPSSYRKELFRTLAPLNEGRLDDAILDRLRAMGVNCIVLHEDMFPEKVSPRPVAFTLKKLLNHPRLELLAHDHAVWSWRILDQPRSVTPVGTSWNIWFPNYRTPPERIDPYTRTALQLRPGQSVRLPAPIFFHRGTIDPERDVVAIDPQHDRTGIVFYGPRLPILAGDYTLTVDFRADLAGEQLGKWFIECPEHVPVTQVVMRAGAPFTCSFTSATGGVLHVIFDYESEAARMELEAVTLQRTR